MSPSNLPNSENLEQRLLEIIRQPQYQPAKPALLAKRLKLDEDQLRDLKRVIKRLISARLLKWGPKHLVFRGDAWEGSQSAPRRSKRAEPGVEPALGEPKNSRASKTRSQAARNPAAQAEVELPTDVRPQVRRLRAGEVYGTFRRAAAGYGFLIPDGAVPGDRSQDLFIPPRKILDAASGDRVIARAGKGRGGDQQRRTGEIVEVVRRRTNRFVGTYRERSGLGLVLVDGGTFDSAILVGDAGAKDCRPGDKVVVEMVRFPSNTDEGEGVIVEILGPRGKPGVDTQMIIHEFGLPGEFPEAVLEDSRRQAEAFNSGKDGGDRTDFTRHTVVTIDPTKARDFDDAISLERLENGHWLLGVHIADVSHFVSRGSELDREAFARGNSVYLPDRVIPMLPEIISNNLASLQPHRRRFTMSVLIELTDKGVVIGADWCRGIIKSAHRFCYEEIDDYLGNPTPWREKLSPQVFELVGNMHRLAMTMRKRRMARGSIDLILPEVAIDLDADGKVSGAHVEEYTESHQVIEEFMLAANEAVAQKLADLDFNLLRRVHEPPSEMKLRDLTEFIRNLGFKTDNLQDRFELKRIVDLARARPEQHAVHFAVLRSMQKAVYSPKDSGHYALASDYYCHFTSPIRRYPDLVIHRMIGDLLDGQQPQADFKWLAQIGQHCSETEVRAEQAERELIKLKLLSYMSDRIGTVFTGTVTGVESFGLFVQGREIPAEGLLHLENLPRDSYVFDSATRTLSGRRSENQFRLGDMISVRVRSVDLERRELEFDYVDSQGRAVTDSPNRSLDGGGTGGRSRAQSPAGRTSGRRGLEGRARAPRASSGSRESGSRESGSRESGSRRPQRDERGGSRKAKRRK